MKEDALIIFIKTPVPGQVKTRLHPELSNLQILSLYQAFINDIHHRFSSMNDFDCWYAVAPEHFNPKKIQQLIDRTPFLMQIQGDLGERMAQSFNDLFDKGYKRIILIGTDIPHLPRQTIINSFQSLINHDVVLGPSEDGGYYLIGLNKRRPELFTDICWSTPHVFEQTTDIIHGYNLKYSLVEPLGDIDDYRALKKIYRLLGNASRSSADFPLKTWQYLQKLFESSEKESIS